MLESYSCFLDIYQALEEKMKRKTKLLSQALEHMILFLLMYFCETLGNLLTPQIVQREVERNATSAYVCLLGQKQPTSRFRFIDILLD
jgi:hypothetical protein